MRSRHATRHQIGLETLVCAGKADGQAKLHRGTAATNLWRLWAVDDKVVVGEEGVSKEAKVSVHGTGDDDHGRCLRCKLGQKLHVAHKHLTRGPKLCRLGLSPRTHASV